MEQNNMVFEQDQIEIDLLEVLAEWKHRFWMIVLAVLIGGGLAGAFSRFVLIPKYTSTAMLYVISKETTLASLADLQIGSQLTKDYKVIITSRPVLEDVIERLGLNMTYKELRKKLTIENPTDTRILSVTVEDPDPYLAKQIVDEIAGTASDYIGEIMEMIPPKLIEDGEASVLPASPHNTRNAVIGAFLGAAAVCSILTLGVVFNDTIRTEEDVAKHMGLTVLATIPERQDEKDKKEMEVAASDPGRKRGKKKGRR